MHVAHEIVGLGRNKAHHASALARERLESLWRTRMRKRSRLALVSLHGGDLAIEGRRDVNEDVWREGFELVKSPFARGRDLECVNGFDRIVGRTGRREYGSKN